MVLAYLIWFHFVKNGNEKFKSISTIFSIVFIILLIDGIMLIDNMKWEECKMEPASIQYMEYKYENYPIKVCRYRDNLNNKFGMWQIP